MKLEQLACEPGYDRMEVAPAKVVPTIKSPSGEEKGQNCHMRQHGASCWTCEGASASDDEIKAVKILMETPLYLLKYLEVEGMDPVVIEVEAAAKPPPPIYMQAGVTQRF